MTGTQVDSSLLSNESPLAKDDMIATGTNEAVVATILDNDMDPDGDNLKILSVESPTNEGGRVIISNSGDSITYYPPKDFAGRDSYSYRITDEDGMTDGARVVITVKNTAQQSQADKAPLKQNNITQEDTDTQLPLTHPPSTKSTTSADQNAKPKADAGRNKIVREGSLVTLDGSRSHDSNSKRVSYIWKQLSGPPVNLEHSDAAKTSFLAPTVEHDTSLEFQLTVTDDIGISNSDVISVSILDIPGNSGESKTDSIEKLILRDSDLEDMTIIEPKINFPWFSALDYYQN